MVREHDKHLLPHNPTLGRERRLVTVGSEGAALLPQGKRRGLHLGAKKAVRSTKLCGLVCVIWVHRRGQLGCGDPRPLTSASLM